MIDLSPLRLGLTGLFLLPLCLTAAEPPYFVTYSQQMEEPGNLEIELQNVSGRPGAGNRFLATAAELEYGVTGWWTSEFYLDGQSTARESAMFTGFRWENRVRPLRREHWINPVLYFEFENVNGADKTLLETVGHDGEADLADSNNYARLEKKREIEAKLILSSNFKGWNISENFIVEKNVLHEPWEFGYAVGVSRRLARAARPDPCGWCRENFMAGVEMYGGLGTQDRFGLTGTSQYVAPTIAWSLPSGTTLKISPGFGLTPGAIPFLLRAGISYEIPQFGRTMRRLLP